MFKNLAPGAIGIQCTWLEGLDLARDAGFTGADLDITQAAALAAERGVEAVRAAYEERGLRIGGWSFPVNWRTGDREFYESLALLPAQAELAAQIGSFRTATWVLPFNTEMSRQDYFARLVNRFGLAAEILLEHDHCLGLEFIGPRTLRAGKPHGIAYTMDGMLTLCSAIGTGNVGLLFDVWHWYTSRGTLDDVRQLSLDDVVYVHINDAPAGVDVLDQVDNRRCLPGETGVIPNAELLKILSDLGYDGPITAEPFSQPLRDLAAQDPLAAAIRTRESLDLVFGQAGI